MTTNPDPKPDERPTTTTTHDVAAPSGVPAIGRDANGDPLPPVNVVTAGMGLARLTVGATAKLGRWGLGASMRVGNRVIKAAITGENATTLIDDATEALREQARDLLGIVDDAGRVVGFQMPTQQPAIEANASSLSHLKARGAALLNASADVHYEEHYHPAYARIIDQMAPDEARILRMMAEEGPQAVVDVRSSGALPGSSETIATALNMIGAEAGVRFLDRMPSYLNNLERLGLVYFSGEEVADHTKYQVLEAQPDVLAALKRANRTKTVRRSLRTTPFGADFAATALK